MKKLMIAVAATAMAVAANAATMDWNIARNLNTDTGSHLVYAFLGGDKAAITSLLQGYATTEAFAANFNADALKAVGGATTYVEGLSYKTGASNGAAAGSIVASDSRLADQATENIFFVVFDADTLADATQYKISKDITGGKAYTAETSGTKAQITSAFNTDALSSVSWNDIGTAVPEPTSGLLLLLGVAGLALRRRRA